MKLQAAKTVIAAKAFPAAKLFPATKVESAPVKSAKVSRAGRLTAGSRLLPVDASRSVVRARETDFFVFQAMVQVRESPKCAICEFAMKELESLLEDQTTEVGFVLLDESNVVMKRLVCWCSRQRIGSSSKLSNSSLSLLRRRWFKLWRRSAHICPPP